LEIGCNVGRNINYLYINSYKNLEAIEISSDALNLFEQNYPDTYQNVTIRNQPVEEALPEIEENRFDLIFTMAVLEHIHDKNDEWLFNEIVNKTSKYMLTIEDESKSSWRHFPRNYRNVFERAGMEQILEERCNLENHGLSDVFMVRLFIKK